MVQPKSKLVSREDALYECKNCSRKQLTWHQLQRYRGVRDCCPSCYVVGVMHTTQRMEDK